MKLAGSMVALVTPMDEGGAVNDRDLKRLIDWHVTSGTDALVIAGTTGESATLAHDEHVALVERACEHAGGRIAIVAGTGSNSTAQTLSLSRDVERLPVAAYLIVTPYYNKPTQEGLFRHFSAVADAVSRPVILYNVPGRTAVDLSVQTTARLAAHDNVIGVKDATGELDRVASLRDLCGDRFMLLSGDDATSREFMLLGGDGVISVTANVAPAAMKALCDAAIAGQRDQAERIDADLQGLHHALFCESNPIPVKWALQQMGRVGPGIRLPLTPLASQCHQAVLDALAKAGIETGTPK
jgi:4-hydroxy-tetrahydrodipicolinate synthase